MPSYLFIREKKSRIREFSKFSKSKKVVKRPKLVSIEIFLGFSGILKSLKTHSRRAVTARSLVVYVNAYADKLALRAVPRNVHEVFSGPALRAKLTHGFLRV